MAFIVLGLESQNDIHYAMPLRCLVYDAHSYDRQYREIGDTHRKNRDLKGAERLSRFARGDKLIPVITLVVYYGTTPWDAPRSLREMIAMPGGNPILASLVPDYPMHLLEVQCIENMEEYEGELKVLLGFVKYQKNLEALLTFVGENEEICKKLPRETLRTIEAVAEIKELEEYIPNIEEQEVINMCDALQQLRQEGRMEGRTEGRREGKLEAEESIILEMLKKKLDIPLIEDITHLPTERILEIKRQYKIQ